MSGEKLGPIAVAGFNLVGEMKDYIRRITKSLMDDRQDILLNAGPGGVSYDDIYNLIGIIKVCTYAL